MSKSERVKVQPLTSYLDDGEYKHATSDPYEVARTHAVELTANGFARMLDGSPHDQGAAPETQAEEPDESKIENDGKPRARRGALQP